MNLLLFQTRRGDIYPVIEKKLSTRSNPVTTGSGRLDQIKRGMHQTYQNLRNKLDYQERLCSQMRHTLELRVYHPSNMDASEAHAKLRDFLQLRYRKHRRWLWIDAVLAFLGIFLMPVPGPNIFFFYPAARTLGHYLARKGAQHALSLNALSFQNDTLMDRVQNNSENLEKVRDTLTELEERYNLQDLETLLTRLGET